MSTRDRASLTARERAVLAHLEALVQAEDPEFARTMRGGRLGRARMLRGAMSRKAGAAARAAAAGAGARLRSPWWGALLVLAGLVVTLSTLGASMATGVAGALMTAVGIGLVAPATLEWQRRRRSQPGGS